MKGRFLAVALALAGAGVLLPGFLHAASVAAVKAPVQQGPSGPAIVAPLGAGGSSLQGGLGPMDAKGTVSLMPSAPNVAVGLLRPGAAVSDPQAPSVFTFPSAKMGFRPEAVPPALPASAIPGAVSPSASWNMNSAVPQVGSFASETAAQFDLPPGPGSPAPEGTLKPGPGGGLSALQRQSFRIAAKNEAVTAQLGATAGSGISSEIGAQRLGRRVMDVLTGERSIEGEVRDFVPGPGAQQAAPYASAQGSVAGAWSSGASRLTGPASEADGALVDASGWQESQVPAPGVARGAEDAAAGPASMLAPGLKAGVNLIALRVYEQGMVLSVVGVPARSMASRLAKGAPGSSDAAEAQLGAAGSKASVPGLQDAVPAAAGAAAWQAVALLGPQAPSAQSESFSFMQSAGQASAPAEAAADSGGAARSDQDSGRSAPVTSPDPLLAASFLPFLGMGLALRSRFFS